MPTLKPTRNTFLALFVASLLGIAFIRGLQRTNPFTDWLGLIVLSLVATPILYVLFNIISNLPTLRTRLVAIVVMAGFVVLIAVSVYVLQLYGFLTGMGFITAIVGPVWTIGLLLTVVIILSNRALRGIGFAIIAAVGTAVLVGILRSLQNLETVWDAGTISLLAVISAIGGFFIGSGVFDPRKLFAGEPSLPRAVWMGIVGFLLGGLFVVVLRGLQNLTPLWDTGTGIVVTGFTTAGFFLWGIGAFDPKMSVHGEAHHPKASEVEKPEAPITILGTYVWQIGFWVLVILLVIAFFALTPGGPFIRTTGDPAGDVAAAGQVTLQMPFGEVHVSQLVVFVGFVLFTLLSLAIFGGGLAILFYTLNRAVTEVQGAPPTLEERTPPAAVQAVGRIGGGVAEWLRKELPKWLGQR